MELLLLTWSLRPEPLAPVALVARGSAVRTLATRLLSWSDEQLAELSGAHSENLLIILADAPATLPWVDGASYLGRDPAAPALLLSTIYAPSVPLPLLERAFRARFPALAIPFAVLPDTNTVVSLADCRKPISRAVLQQRIGDD